jgi:hypothetical protein
MAFFSEQQAIQECAEPLNGCVLRVEACALMMYRASQGLRFICMA